MQGIRRRKWSVRRAYARRTQFNVFFDGLFVAVFSEVLTVSSRISSFPQILGLSESRRQSPGWHSPSFWTTCFTHRAPFLLQEPWGGCLVAHRVSSGLHDITMCPASHAADNYSTRAH